MAGEASSAGICGDSDARPSGSASERWEIRSLSPQRYTVVLKPCEALRGSSSGLTMPLAPGTTRSLPRRVPVENRRAAETTVFVGLVELFVGGV